jgi:pyochelin biosynthesis protein PchC
MTQGTTKVPGGWMRWHQPELDSPFRLVCLPHAGGVASFFAPLAAVLRPATEVLAVQYPGRPDRSEHQHPLAGGITELADELSGALLPWTDSPFALLGHSMGALVAFEVARRLEAAGRRPLRLFASSAGAPVPRPDRRLREMSDAGLMAELRRLDGMKPRSSAGSELLRRTLPAVRRDIAAVETYTAQPGARVACPVTALTGDSDSAVTLDDARAWGDFTTAPFDLEVFPGGHFYLVKQRRRVAEAVNGRTAGAGGRSIGSVTGSLPAAGLL